jgi:hypothetical protein
LGYGIVHDILSSIYDEIPISLEYNDLYDSKTRLKELFDTHKELGDWKYIDSRDDMLAESKAYMVPNEIKNKQPLKRKTGPGKKDFVSLPQAGWVLLGKGVAAKKADAQQKAAEAALCHLNGKGIVKGVSEEYKRFAKLPGQGRKPGPKKQRNHAKRT